MCKTISCPCRTIIVNVVRVVSLLPFFSAQLLTGSARQPLHLNQFLQSVVVVFTLSLLPPYCYCYGQITNVFRKGRLECYFSPFQRQKSLHFLVGAAKMCPKDLVKPCRGARLQSWKKGKDSPANAQKRSLGPPKKGAAQSVWKIILKVSSIIKSNGFVKFQTKPK